MQQKIIHTNKDILEVMSKIGTVASEIRSLEHMFKKQANPMLQEKIVDLKTDLVLLRTKKRQLKKHVMYNDGFLVYCLECGIRKDELTQ